MKKPKIICTLGTKTDDQETLKAMIDAGMSCARINTAYATTQDYQRRIDLVKQVADIDIMMDIKGPQIRLETDHAYKIEEGDIIYTGFGREPIHFTKNFYDDVKPGDLVQFENGTIKTRIGKKFETILALEILDKGEGIIHKQMGVNVPGAYLNVKRLSPKDMVAIELSVKNHLSYIAWSYTRDYEDLSYFNNVLRYYKKKYHCTKDIGSVIKIEDKHGVDNLEDIIIRSKLDKINLGVMIGRGDLYVEFPQEELPILQEKMIRTCRKHGIFVITATGVLESMQYKGEPSRAEICDVYSAFRQGTNAYMFSGETGNGVDPARAVRKLSEILDRYMASEKESVK